MHSELRIVIDYFLHVDPSLSETQVVSLCVWLLLSISFMNLNKWKSIVWREKKGILVKGEVGCEEVNHSLSRVDRIVNINQ